MAINISEWEPVESESDLAPIEQSPSNRERDFQNWYAGIVKDLRGKGQLLNPNPDDPGHFYDYRKAYQLGLSPTLTEHGDYRWPDIGKLSGHPVPALESESDWEPVAEPQGIFTAPSGIDVGTLGGQISSSITGVPSISLPEDRPIQDWFAPSVPEQEPKPLTQADIIRNMGGAFGGGTPEQMRPYEGTTLAESYQAIATPFAKLPEFTPAGMRAGREAMGGAFGGGTPDQMAAVNQASGYAAAAALLNNVKSVVEFAESPLGLATWGAAGAGGSAIQKLIGLGFSADIASNIPEAVNAAKKAKTPEEKGTAYVNLAVTLGMPVALALPAIKSAFEAVKPLKAGETYAIEKGIEQTGRLGEYPGIPRGENLPTYQGEVRQGEGGRPSGGGGAVTGAKGEVIPPVEPPTEVKPTKTTPPTPEELAKRPLGGITPEEIGAMTEEQVFALTKSKFPEDFSIENLRGNQRGMQADGIAYGATLPADQLPKIEALAKSVPPSSAKAYYYRAVAEGIRGANNLPGGVVATYKDMVKRGLIKEAVPTEPAKPTTAGAAEAAPAEAPKPGIISGTALEKWASDRLAESQKRLTVGIDPELMVAYAIKGAAILERGVRDFAKWSGEMVKEYGEDIKPHLRRIYQQANNVFTTPGRYAIEEGKLKIVSEQEARRMERAVKLSKNVAGIKDQLDLFDKEIGDALTEGGRLLPKDLRPEIAKGAPAEKRTVTNKEINQYFVNKLVTVRKAMQKLKTEMETTADPASQQYFDVLQKRFELAFRQVQELRRASHESLYFWNEIKAEYQDIARMAGEMPEIKRRLPIIDQIFKDLKNKEFARAGKDFVDYLRVNLFTPFSFTLDFTSNVLAVAGHTPAWLAMDMAHLITGKPMTRTASALRALKLSGKNMIPTAERFRLPEEIEVGLGTTAGGEFQGLPKEVMVDFSEILKSKPKLAEKLKNLDYVLGGPVRMKRAVDNFFGRFGATAELYNAAYQAGRGKGLKGDGLKQFVDQFVLNPPEQAVADAIRVGGEFKFNRNLPAWAERFAGNIITKLAVESYPRWTLQFTKWAGEMLGVDPGFIRKAAKGEVTPEHVASYLAKAATGWGALYAFNQIFYNQVDPNTMEYVNEKGERVRLSGRQPFPELYMLTALFRGDIDNAKAAFPYTSIPFAGMTGGQGGLLSPIMQTMIESWKGNYTAEQTARELTKIVNNAIPGKSMLGLIRAIYDPTIREGIGAPIPGVAQALPTRVNVTTGEPMAPKQRIPGTPIKLPTVGGTPFPGAVRMLNPIEKTLLNHGISNVRPKRTSLIELPAEEIPKELRREYEQHVGRNVNAIIGEAIQSKDWLDLAGKENFDTRRELLMAWMTLARTMAKAELAEKYNKGMGAEKTAPLTVRRLPEFVKELPAPR